MATNVKLFYTNCEVVWLMLIIIITYMDSYSVVLIFKLWHCIHFHVTMGV